MEGQTQILTATSASVGQGYGRANPNSSQSTSEKGWPMGEQTQTHHEFGYNGAWAMGLLTLNTG